MANKQHKFFSNRTALAASLTAGLVIASASTAFAQDNRGDWHGRAQPAPANPAAPARPAAPAHAGFQQSRPAQQLPAPQSPVRPQFARPAAPAAWGHPAPAQTQNQTQNNWTHQQRPQAGWNAGPGRQGTYNQAPRGNYQAWNRGWHNDNRYDWRGWRGENHAVFHLGRYYPPYQGFYYRPLSIGFVLDQMFWGDNYMINDPWTYHLPPASPPNRWVRYYDDALLVDTYSGQVGEVMHDFFW